MQENWQLGHETLYTSVGLVDLILSSEKNIPRTQLQLLGATAIFLASKFYVSILFYQMTI